MLKTNLDEIFSKKSDFCEKTSSKPVKSLVPGQAIKLSELISRFEKGQRLGTHLNFEPGSNFTRDSQFEEDYEDAPPDGIFDIVDVEEFKREHEAHKREYARKQKEKAGKKDEPKLNQGEDAAPTSTPNPDV